MKFLLPILLITLNCFSQHTERFRELVKTVERDSIAKDTLFFKNGNIEFLGEKSFYTSNDIIVETYSGESKLFYANGVIARNDMQDQFGHWLWSKYYDRKGVLTTEWIITKIDSRAKSLEDFFASRNHINSEKTIKHYRYSKKANRLYTYKIEYLVTNNGIDSGKEDFLNEDEKVIRTKFLKKKKHKNVW